MPAQTPLAVKLLYLSALFVVCSMAACDQAASRGPERVHPELISATQKYLLDRVHASSVDELDDKHLEHAAYEYLQQHDLVAQYPVILRSAVGYGRRSGKLALTLFFLVRSGDENVRFNLVDADGKKLMSADIELKYVTSTMFQIIDIRLLSPHDDHKEDFPYIERLTRPLEPYEPLVLRMSVDGSEREIDVRWVPKR